jgi:hypothetical protein
MLTTKQLGLQLRQLPISKEETMSTGTNTESRANLPAAIHERNTPFQHNNDLVNNPAYVVQSIIGQAADIASHTPMNHFAAVMDGACLKVGSMNDTQLQALAANLRTFAGNAFREPDDRNRTITVTAAVDELLYERGLRETPAVPDSDWYAFNPVTYDITPPQP